MMKKTYLSIWNVVSLVNLVALTILCDRLFIYDSSYFYGAAMSFWFSFISVAYIIADDGV